MSSRAGKRNASRPGEDAPTRAKPVGSARPNRRRAKRIDREDGERRGRQVVRQQMILGALSAAPRGLTVHELQELTEDGTLRTTYRDLEQLQEAGFALSNDAGRWVVEPRARVSVPVPPEEVLALVVATEAIGARGPFSAPLHTLRRKLLAAMTPKARAYCEQLSDTSVATTLGQATVAPAVADAAREAIEKEQLLTITHAKPGEAPRRRVVEPYGTWIADGRAYLVARSPGKAQPQHFHLARITAAEVLDETFERDPSFSLEEYARTGFGAFHGPMHEVAIELAPEVAHVARESEYHPTQEVEELGDGRVLLRMQTAGLPRLAAWIAGFGGKARAVEPPELIELVCALGEGAVRVHRA